MGKDRSLSGRNPFLDGAAKEKIKRKINERAANKNPISYRELQQYIRDEFSVVVSLEYLYKWISKENDIKSIEAEIMEKDRVEVDICNIKDYFNTLKSYADGIPSNFVFNCDETGIQQWVDRLKNLTVIVPSNVESAKIGIQKSNEKRLTVLFCISMDGTYIKPYVLTERLSVNTKLLERGLTPDKIEFIHTVNGFMNSDIFLKWLLDVFIPELQIRRKKYNYEGMAILVMDGFGSHLNFDSLDVLTRENVKVVYMPPHSSHLLQALDVTLFGLFKKELQYNKLTFSEDKVFNTQVLNLFSTWQKTSTSNNIIQTFKDIGMKNVCNEDFDIVCQVIPQLCRKFDCGITEECINSEIERMQKETSSEIGKENVEESDIILDKSEEIVNVHKHQSKDKVAENELKKEAVCRIRKRLRESPPNNNKIKRYKKVSVRIEVCEF